MKRREFGGATLGMAIAWPGAILAQQGVKVPRVGVLSPGNPPPADSYRQRERFEGGMAELGWKPGTTILIDYRYAEGKLDRLPGQAAELAAMPVDIIVARGLTIAAARQATATIPIIMAADPDPVRSGFVASLARPGGNITGLSTLAQDTEAKSLQLLREAMPAVVRVALLTNAHSSDGDLVKRNEPAARALGFELTDFPIGAPDQLEAAFAKMSDSGAGAAICSANLWFINATQVAALSQQHRLPTVHNLRQFTEAGAFMSYGVDFAVLHRRVATYVDKILKGANPGTLPVEQPTKFELVINQRTAKTLGIAVPQSLLARADEVIE